MCSHPSLLSLRPSAYTCACEASVCTHMCKHAQYQHITYSHCTYTQQHTYNTRDTHTTPTSALDTLRRTYTRAHISHQYLRVADCTIHYCALNYTEYTHIHALRTDIASVLSFFFRTLRMTFTHTRMHTHVRVTCVWHCSVQFSTVSYGAQQCACVCT